MKDDGCSKLGCGIDLVGASYGKRGGSVMLANLMV